MKTCKYFLLQTTHTDQDKDLTDKSRELDKPTEMSSWYDRTNKNQQHLEL